MPPKRVRKREDLDKYNANKRNKRKHKKAAEEEAAQKAEKKRLAAIQYTKKYQAKTQQEKLQANNNNNSNNNNMSSTNQYDDVEVPPSPNVHSPQQGVASSSLNARGILQPPMMSPSVRANMSDTEMEVMNQSNARVAAIGYQCAAGISQGVRGINQGNRDIAQSNDRLFQLFHSTTVREYNLQHSVVQNHEEENPGILLEPILEATATETTPNDTEVAMLESAEAAFARSGMDQRARNSVAPTTPTVAKTPATPTTAKASTGRKNPRTPTTAKTSTGRKNPRTPTTAKTPATSSGAKASTGRKNPRTPTTAKASTGRKKARTPTVAKASTPSTGKSSTGRSTGRSTYVGRVTRSSSARQINNMNSSDEDEKKPAARDLLSVRGTATDSDGESEGDSAPLTAAPLTAKQKRIQEQAAKRARATIDGPKHTLAAKKAEKEQKLNSKRAKGPVQVKIPVRHAGDIQPNDLDVGNIRPNDLDVGDMDVGDNAFSDEDESLAPPSDEDESVTPPQNEDESHHDGEDEDEEDNVHFGFFGPFNLN